MKNKLLAILAICALLPGCGKGTTGQNEISLESLVSLQDDGGSYVSEPEYTSEPDYDISFSSREEASEPQSIPEEDESIAESAGQAEAADMSSGISIVEQSESVRQISGASSVSSQSASSPSPPVVSAPEASQQKKAQVQPNTASSAEEPSKPPQSVSSSAPQSSGNYLSDIELEVIGLINAERSASGLGELVYDASLTKAARIRSAEMFAGNFFAHTRKSGAGWETVLSKEVPVKYKSAGENLAMVEHNMPSGDPVEDASYWYETWEKSPGHYKNMVKSEFTHVGVGIYYGTRDGLKTAIATTVFVSY